MAFPPFMYIQQLPIGSHFDVRQKSPFAAGRGIPAMHDG
jgi:hypothetical protein